MDDEMTDRDGTSGHELLELVRRSGKSEWRFLIQGTPVDGWPLILADSKSMGRHVLASRDIAAGELLFTDEPFAQTVHERCHATVCHLCYGGLDKPGIKPVVCNDCKQVCFCSTTCARTAEAAHEDECGVLCALSASSAGAAALRSFRGLRLFIRLVHRAFEEPAEFRAVEAMAQHYDDATPERRQWLETMASQVNRFVPPERRMETARLARLVSNVHTNLYGIVDQAGLQYGSGLYPRAGSLFNHSCSPSCAVSFLGRQWRLHALMPIRRGAEVTVSYVEVYAARAERRSAIEAKKGFACQCSRCKRPLPADAQLDGWRCAVRECAQASGVGGEGSEAGVVPAGAACCVRCGATHRLSQAARDAREHKWRAALEDGSAWAHGTFATGSVAGGGGAAGGAAGGASGGADEGAARRTLAAADRVMQESGGQLCEHHALRHTARKLRVYALSALGAKAGHAEMVAALEALLDGMTKHLPAAHPEASFVTYRLAEALWQQAAEAGASGTAARGRAKEHAAVAVTSLAVAYGTDHPTVRAWRESFRV